MLLCPDCGSSEVTVREAESSPLIKWFNCKNGHKFFHKTRWGKGGEFTGIAIAASIAARLFLDHDGFADMFDDTLN